MVGFTPIWGIFDEHIFFRWVGSTTNKPLEKVTGDICFYLIFDKMHKLNVCVTETFECKQTVDIWPRDVC